TLNREYVFARLQEGAVDGPLRFGDVSIQSFYQFLNGRSTHAGLILAVHGHQSRTWVNRTVVARAVVVSQQVTQFHSYQLRHLSVFVRIRTAAVFSQQVSFVQEHNNVRYAYLTGQQDVLTGLRHRAVSRTTHRDRAVHLRSTGNHVFNVVGVARAIYVCVVAGRGLVFDGGRWHWDSTLTPSPCLVGTG